MTFEPKPLQRTGDRAISALRPFEIVPHISPHAEGSALIKVGETHVYCTASVEETVPPFKKGRGEGWVTAEYAMLPRATKQRTARSSREGRQDGRAVEIQRLIGRSLRAAVDFEALGERQIIVDCDVIQADGGTRCAAITGGYVALALAIRHLQRTRKISSHPLKRQIAAVSAGVIRGTPALDLDYAEDRDAEVDFNVVMTSDGDFIEVQGTAEHRPFSRSALDEILALASAGLDQLFAAQRVAVDTPKR